MNSMVDTLITNFYVIMVGQIEILKLDLKQLTDIVVASDEHSKEIRREQELFNKAQEKTFYAKNGETVKIFDAKRTSDKYFQRENTIETNNYNEEKFERLLNERVIKCAEHYKEIIR